MLRAPEHRVSVPPVLGDNAFYTGRRRARDCFVLCSVTRFPILLRVTARAEQG